MPEVGAEVGESVGGVVLVGGLGGWGGGGGGGGGGCEDMMGDKVGKSVELRGN